MLLLYRDVALLAARRAVRAWPVALSFVIYAAILAGAAVLLGPLGIVGGFAMGLVLASCWSSYLELISQAVAGSRIRLRWDDFRRTFAARFWDVISVMFAFWIISLLLRPAMAGPQGVRVAAVVGIAIAFFFNVVPELLYQGHSRSFALLIESGRFMVAHPVVWLLPNVLFAALALLPTGQLAVEHPIEILLVLGQIFSSPSGAAALFTGLPPYTWPVALFALHYVMVFRGILFKELSAGAGNARLRAFRAKMQG